MSTWSARNLTTDEARDPPGHHEGRASWYAQGLSDAIGDRLLMFDNSGGPSLELLRFSWKVVACPGFEDALRERVELLSQFRHSSFTKVRAVEKLEPKNDLTLVSNHVSGKRLSDDLSAVRGPAFAMWFIRELVPALVALQDQGRGVAHGAVTAERIVLTTEGRLVMVEHVLGAALDRLQLPRHDMWLRFGIATAPTTAATGALDPQTDVFQLGLVALSILLGRSITAYQYPSRLGELLDRFPMSAGRELPSSLRSWLMRALHLTGEPFASARDAQNGLGELNAAPATAALPIDVFGVAPRTLERQEPKDPDPPDRLDRPDPSDRLSRSDPPDRAPRLLPETEQSAAPSLTRASKRYAEAGRASTTAPPWEREIVASDLLNERRLELAQRYTHARSGVGAFVVAGLIALVVVQGAYIGYLLYSPPPAIVVRPPQPVVVSTVAQPAAESNSVLLAAAAVSGTPPSSKPPEPANTAAPTPRSGGVRLVSQIELQLLEGDRLLGSSADGPIIITAGRHEFEVVNNALGYRSRQVATIKPGEILSMSIAHPEGRISINAVPWADVWIDRVHVGETPLANLSIPIGQHEVSFRHPSFGEQRRTTTVRFDVPTRLSADLR